jgi:DNA modification methylase
MSQAIPHLRCPTAKAELPCPIGIGFGDLLDAIVCADCLDILRKMDDKSVDVTITDPPYGTTGYAWDKAQDWQVWWKEIKRVTRGRVVVTAALPFTIDMVNSNRAGFKYWWTWSKGKAGNFAIAKHQPLRVTEEVLVFEDGAYYPQMRPAEPDNMRPRGSVGKSSDIIRLKSGVCKSRDEHDESERWPVNLLEIDSTQAECNQVNRLHPTQKPLELMRYIIETYTLPGEIVLDPFCGSGSTCVAAKQTGRHYLGIEKDKHYAETTETRLLQELPLGV